MFSGWEPVAQDRCNGRAKATQPNQIQVLDLKESETELRNLPSILFNPLSLRAGSKFGECSAGYRISAKYVTYLLEEVADDLHCLPDSSVECDGQLLLVLSAPCVLLHGDDRMPWNLPARNKQTKEGRF